MVKDSRANVVIIRFRCKRSWRDCKMDKTAINEPMKCLKNIIKL